jgi:hypothetical protein
MAAVLLAHDDAEAALSHPITGTVGYRTSYVAAHGTDRRAYLWRV